MKNIHILSANKPSRLGFIYESNQYHIINGKDDFLDNLSIDKNIYITSDEEIKEGDWYIINSRYISKCVRRSKTYINGSFYTSGCKKVILTTDQDLIKDGVQDIDEKFLEWFVENPSCEWVEVVDGLYFDDVEWISCYKIIIPKEEPKQIKCYDKFNQILKEGDYVDVQKDGIYKIYKKEDGQLYFNPYGGEDKVSNYFSNDMVKCDKDGNWITNNQYKDIDEPKQETLEDAAERFLKNGAKEFKTAKQVLIEFAKSQQEQNKNLYTEEDIRKMFSKYNEVIAHRDIEEWQPWIDKQFKKK